METEILQTAVAQGIWTTLAVGLIFYILRHQEERDSKQEERESKYQLTILTLSENLKVVNEIKSELKELIKK